MRLFSAHSTLPALLTLIAACSGFTTACGDGENLDLGGDGAESAETVGSVGLKLELGADVALNTIDYQISGNGFTKSGTIDVSDSNVIRGVIGGIPAGTGYSIRLSTNAAANGGAACEGTSTFGITAGATTTARVSLRCRVPGRTGKVEIEGEVNVCPVVSSLSALPVQASVGGVIALAAESLDLDGAPSPVSVEWTASGGILTANGATAELECVASGPISVTVTVSDGDCEDTDSLSLVCTDGTGEEPETPDVRINEIESSGGTPGDWVELYNAGAIAADISGWIVRDNDDSHVSAIPAGTVLAPGAYYVVEESALGYGLGGGDSVRLFDAEDELVDSHTWPAHATTSYGRCPNATGAFGTQATVTKGQPNDCLPEAPETVPWPGTASVDNVDVVNTWTSNLSGLTYQPALDGASAVLWAGLNGPGTLYRLLWNGVNWVSDTSNDWSAGKALRYPNGTGNPDTEGVTKAAWDSSFIYTSTERNNDASTVSRLAVLRFDTNASGATLTATHEWNLTADLPAVGANLGLEAVTFVPDAFLVANAFLDQSTNAAYNPANYPDHAGGLFFVGVEGTGAIHAYALNHADSTFVRIATIQSGHPGVMGLEFDRDAGYLWALCDDTCNNTANVLAIDRAPSSPSYGRFIVRRIFERAPTLPNANNEGFAIAPESECVAGQKSVFWSDDNNTGTHSLRRGSLPCGPLF